LTSVPAILRVPGCVASCDCAETLSTPMDSNNAVTSVRVDNEGGASECMTISIVAA
jgi:hypothetical protein